MSTVLLRILLYFKDLFNCHFLCAITTIVNRFYAILLYSFMDRFPATGTSRSYFIYSISISCHVLCNNDHLSFFNSALGERHTFDCRANQISTVETYNYVTHLNYYHWQQRYVKIEMQLKLRRLSKTPFDDAPYLPREFLRLPIRRSSSG